MAAAGLLTESGSRRKRKLNYSSAFAYELISQLRSISSCCGAVHSMVGSFGAWYDEKRIARLLEKYIGEIRYVERAAGAADGLVQSGDPDASLNGLRTIFE